MSNQFTELNPGSGGSIMDETGVTYPTAPTVRRRTRIVLAGDGLNELVQVKNTDLNGDEYGLIVRSLPTCPTNSILSYNQDAAVSDNTETTLTSYTVPAGTTFYFTGVVAQGDLPARFRIYIDSNIQLSYRTVSSNPAFQQTFSLPPFTAAAGSVIYLKVTHFISGVSGDFEGTILGYTI